MRKLSDSDREKIRQMYAEGCSQRMIGQMYGVSQQHISIVVDGVDVDGVSDKGTAKGRKEGVSEIVCPNCGSKNTFVCDKRPKPYGIRRRRWCVDCDGRFSTVEVNVETNRTIHLVGVIYKDEAYLWEAFKEWRKNQGKTDENGLFLMKPVPGANTTGH